MTKQTKKQAAEQGFHSILADGGPTPEAIMIAVMRGDDSVNNGKATGRPVKITQRMVDAAEKLLPYRLPKLNSVDAVQRNVEMTHEDWIASIDNEDD